MKKLLFSLFIFLFFITSMWGQTLVKNEETETKRLVINASEYDTIVFRNSKFEETVIIAGNENLKTINFYNCDFSDMVTIRDNPSLTSVNIASSNFKKHLLVNNNVIEGEASFIDNFITGYFQFTKNKINDNFSISLSRVESGISCFNNTFSSKAQINNTNFGLRSFFYGNLFNALEYNDVSFVILLMQDNNLEKSIGFADCIVMSNLTIRKLNDTGNPNTKRSISFFNTSVNGNVYFDEIAPTVLLLDLWQLDFHQDIFLDYNRLTDSIGLITDRIVYNPYIELSNEKLQRFNQLFTRIMSGFDRRGERENKINFAKWEFHYKNNFNAPFVKLLNKILFYISFDLFLNVFRPVFFSLIICVGFMFIYIQKNKEEEKKPLYLYLKIDHLINGETTNGKKRLSNFFERYFIAFGTSISVFCNIPLATKKLREEEARSITWLEGMLGLIMLMIIAAIISRIATI